MVSRPLATLVFVTLAVTAGAVSTMGPVTGSDNVTIYQVDPESPEAPPGETVHVAVLMTSDGGYGDVGVDNATVGMDYDSDALTLESIERGPWMEQGPETEIVTDTEIDDEAGYGWIGQDRDPPEDGAVGQDRLATFTFSVDENADEGEYDLELVDGHAELTNEWPQQIFHHHGTLVVDEDATVSDAGPLESGDRDSETNGEDTESADGSDDTPSEEETDDPTYGFGLGIAAFTVALVAVARKLL